MRRVPRLLSVIFLSLLAGCASGGKGRMSPTRAAGSCDKPGAGAGAGAGALYGAAAGLSAGPAAIIVAPGFAVLGAIIGAMAGSKSWCPDVATASRAGSVGSAADPALAPPDTGATAPTVSSVAPAARIDRQLHVRGPGACTVVGRPAGEADFQALRRDLDQCWQARIAVAQGFCDKNLGAAGPPCYSAQEARKYRADALAAFDADWRRRTVL